MNQADSAPIYNLKAVVQETGLKSDTLRAWERRYGLPSPERTASGHRLYSLRDINTIKWLVARQQEGLTIKRAVELWHQIEHESGDPLNNNGPLAAELDVSRVRPPATVQAPLEPSDNTLGELRRSWVNACLQFDEPTAEHMLVQAFSLFPTELVCVQVLQRGLAEIGQGWHQGRITAQQEHFASALAIRRLEAMLASTPTPYQPGRILVGCPPEEEHTFAPLMLALMLRRRGYDVIYLGANVPLRSIEATIMSTNPELVILSAQQLFTAATMLEMAALFVGQGIPLAYGGLVFRTLPELAKVIPGYYLGDRLDNSLQAVEQIMMNPKVQSAARRPSDAYILAHDHFQQRRSLIEAQVWKRLDEDGIPQRRLASANHTLGRNILAALALGNLDFLGPDLDWIEDLLVNHYQMPVEKLDRYLEIYLAAVTDNLDHDGQLVIDWLKQMMSPQALTATRPDYRNHRLSIYNS